MDGQGVSDAFGLGRAHDLSEPVARGELGEIRRLETEHGTFAVKQELEEGAGAEVETSTAYQRACWEAGIPTPEPLRTTSGGFAARVGGEQVRAYTWADLHDTDTELDPATVGALVARLHAVVHPWPTTVVDPWFEAPVGRAEWKGVLKAARAAGAPYVDRLAEVLPALVEVEQILTPMRPAQTCHLDMWADNLRSTPSGDLCLIDFDNAGPADPSREIAMVVYEFGRGGHNEGDPARQRALYDAYLDAGGPGRIRGRGDLALTVAQIHHIGHRHLTMWLGARDDEARARSLAGIEEFLDEPLLLDHVERLVGAVSTP
jgi:Ser/Thr protein kinase RdoA (MazF antagonist)